MKLYNTPLNITGINSMAHNAQCHLSNLLIKEDEPVIAIPVNYSMVKHTTTLTYTTNSSACPFWLPIKAQYNGYGSIHNVDSDSITNKLFLNFMNKNLFNSEEEVSPFNPNTFYIFKDDYDRPAHGEFITDEKALANRKDKDAIYPLTQFESIEQFFELAHSRSIFNISGTVSRVGFILIKESVFNLLVELDLKSITPELKTTITDFVNLKSVSQNIEIDVDAPDDIFFKASEQKEISDDFIHSDILSQFNGSRNLSHIIKIELIRHWRKHTDQHNEAIISGLLDSASINLLYQRLGKSFYPNATRSGDMSSLMHLNNIINSEIQTVQESNIKSLMADGYDPVEDKDIFQKSKFQDW